MQSIDPVSEAGGRGLWRCSLMTPSRPSQSCRLYATRHLRVLLRANAEFFSNWGVELLVTQLYDRSQPVRLEALDVLDEACEDKVRGHDPGG